MAVTAILDFVKVFYFTDLPVKYGDNRLNGSKVIALFSFSKMAVAAILNCVIWPYLSLYLYPICEL
jgi:hypothetical protein